MEEFLTFINENVIAVISVVASLFATVISIRSYVIAKRAYKISEEQHLDRKKELDLYLIKIEKHIDKDDSWIYTNISITNNATLPKPIIKTFLEIKYQDKNLKLQNVKQDSSPDPKIMTNKTDELCIPLNIDALTITSGHLYFKIPEHLLQYTIKKFRLVLQTSNKDEIEIESELWEEKNVTN